MVDRVVQILVVHPYMLIVPIEALNLSSRVTSSFCLLISH
jgi:hypothetical protein